MRDRAVGQATAVMLAPSSVLALALQQPATGRTQHRIAGVDLGGMQAPDVAP